MFTFVQRIFSKPAKDVISPFRIGLCTCCSIEHVEQQHTWVKHAGTSTRNQLQVRLASWACIRKLQNRSLWRSRRWRGACAPELQRLWPLCRTTHSASCMELLAHWPVAFKTDTSFIHSLRRAIAQEMVVFDSFLVDAPTLDGRTSSEYNMLSQTTLNHS